MSGADDLRGPDGRLPSVAEFDELVAHRASRGVTYVFHPSVIRELLAELADRDEARRTAETAVAQRDAVVRHAARLCAAGNKLADAVTTWSDDAGTWPDVLSALAGYREIAGGEA